MTLTRGIQNRLRQLEVASRPPAAVFFLAWGFTPAEVIGAVSEAMNANLIRMGDTVVRALWPYPHSRPTSRWITNDVPGLPRAEFGALAMNVELALKAAVERTASSDGDGNEERLARRLVTRWNGGDDPLPREPTPDNIRRASDAQLFAAAIGERLGEQRPAGDMSGEARVALLARVLQLDVRDAIRGATAARSA